MKIIFIGDIYGKTGRKAVFDHLLSIRERYEPDFIILNSDNAAHGYGITPKIANHFFDAGIDAITTGDHVWDRREIIPYIAQEKRLIRPLNCPENTPGHGYSVLEKNGKTLIVVHLIGRTMMAKSFENPFHCFDAHYPAIERFNPDAVLVDFHAEATSEKMAMGRYCDGRVSAVIGTHTHVPTGDAHILSKGTAYMTDAGMSGDFDSIIGVQEKSPLLRFLEKDPKARYQPAEGEATVCGVMIETSSHQKTAIKIEPFKVGGILDDFSNS